MRMPYVAQPPPAGNWRGSWTAPASKAPTGPSTRGATVSTRPFSCGTCPDRASAVAPWKMIAGPLLSRVPIFYNCKMGSVPISSLLVPDLFDSPAACRF